MTEPRKSRKGTFGNDSSSLSNSKVLRTAGQDGSLSNLYENVRTDHDDLIAFLSSIPLIGAKVDFSLCTQPATPDFEKEAALHNENDKPRPLQLTSKTPWQFEPSWEQAACARTRLEKTGPVWHQTFLTLVHCMP